MEQNGFKFDWTAKEKAMKEIEEFNNCKRSDDILKELGIEVISQ